MAGKGQPKTGGRRKGTPNKAIAELRARAQEHGQEAIETLAKLARTADSDAVKIAACRVLLDRAYGKPQQAVTGIDGAPLLPDTITISIVSPEIT